MAGRVSAEQEQTRNFEPRAGRDLTWSGQIEFREFRTRDREMSVMPPPSFMKEGLDFPGNVEVVVSGQFGLLIRDEEEKGYIVTSTKKPDWVVRPQVGKLVDVVFNREHFLKEDALYNGLIAAGCMSGGKSTLLREIADQAVQSRNRVLLIRPSNAREIDIHQELIDKHPRLISFQSIDSVDEIMVAVNSHNPDLVVLDEMNLLVYADSPRFETREKRAIAIAEAIKEMVENGIKFAGALLDRYATGRAFPPINEVITLQKSHRRIEIFRMHAQCLCGAVAEVQAMTELWSWLGGFTNGSECLVRPLVPIDEERKAVENFYGPLCSHCHHRIHGEQAGERWDVIDFSTARSFTTLDLF